MSVPATKPDSIAPAPASNRRTHTRYPVWSPVTLMTSSREYLTICRDVGPGGILVSSPTDVRTDTTVTCHFRPALEATAEIIATGRVVRTERNADELKLVFPVRIAIEFEPSRPDIEEHFKNTQAGAPPSP